MMIEFEALKTIIEECTKDVASFNGGNKAAGTRVRKAMQSLKDQAQLVRKAVLEKEKSK